MGPESTHYCCSGITSVDVLSASVPLFPAFGKAPGTCIGTTLRNALDIHDQVNADLAHYGDRAAALAGSTNAMSTLSQYLHESIATSSLFNVDRYGRYLKRAYRLLRQAHAAADVRQEPVLCAEVRQA
tara:strand:- start:354 stop:737 length:384 start_codon:yes stop_codon:yes gene_type:complete